MKMSRGMIAVINLDDDAVKSGNLRHVKDSLSEKEKDPLVLFRSCACREHPLDIQMQLHEVERQIEGHAKVDHFSYSDSHNEVPSEIWNKILLKAKREYSNNFAHQSYELQQQMSAYIKIVEMRITPPHGINQKRMAKSIEDAEREYPDDYSMQVFLIEQSFVDDTE